MHLPQRTVSASPRMKCAILLFTICCLLSTIRILRQAPTPVHITRDDVSKKSDERFAAVKTRLPASGAIGYIGETGNDATPDFYLTQYALQPLAIDSSTH